MLEAAAKEPDDAKRARGGKIATDVALVPVNGSCVELGDGVDLRGIVFLDQLDVSTWVPHPRKLNK